ncbi:hypothetical protein BLNAU_9741 [Blattamonas nauphoetae]|uniref:Uncharacterized protein n=1 Tax=Blattamonas nauphoetae TaxID=2049346 RepID=A0ABQ9XV39_9EUKA|nr:hypothetical protein BLNAU_9741 [Blattamonas nauphoetae]
MTNVEPSSHSSNLDSNNRFTVTAAESYPIEKFNDLLASMSNANEHDPHQCLLSIKSLLRRYLNHMTKEQRNDVLHRVGVTLSQRDYQDIDIGMLNTIGLFLKLPLSILKQIKPHHTDYHQLVQLSQISEICPLISIPALTEDLSSFFRNVMCHLESYLGNNRKYRLDNLLLPMDILNNEILACTILGIDGTVLETVVSCLSTFTETLSRLECTADTKHFNHDLMPKIVQISQIYTDPVDRIAASFHLLTDQDHHQFRGDLTSRENLISQCHQHTATFLNAHPDLIDSFLKAVDLSKIHIYYDRHLNLISILSQSSSPLFTKLCEPLLDPTFHLDFYFSPDSFTDPASSFFRIASSNPSFFHRFVETNAFSILDMALSTALCAVRVVSDKPSEPHCLDFGRATQNWVVLLKAMAEAKMDLSQSSKHFNSNPSYLLTLLVLSAASTNEDLSTAAVSVFSHLFGLSTSHTEALLFATPTTFPVSDTFASQRSQELEESDCMRVASQSLCAEAGRCVVLESRSEITLDEHHTNFVRLLGIPFAGCLVNALHSTTTIPHSFPFFSPELCALSQQPSVWNDSSQPSALPALTMLADIAIDRAYGFGLYKLNCSHQDMERRDTACVHLFPFLGPESQTQFLSSFNWFARGVHHPVHSSLDRIVECLVEMATVNSFNTPIALLAEMKNVTELPFFHDPETAPVKNLTTRVSPFEKSITERLRTAEGEERWKLLTQLAVVSRGDPGFVEERMKAENDAQALLILSIHTIRSTPRLDFHLDSNPDAFDRVVEFTGRCHNLPLVSAALAHIGDTADKEVRLPRHQMLLKNDKIMALKDLGRSSIDCSACSNSWENRCQECNQSIVYVPTLRCSTFGGISPPDTLDHRQTYRTTTRYNGLRQTHWTHAGKNYEMTSLMVDSCLKVFQFMMSIESFDPTPFIDVLVSLAATTDLSLLHFILLALQQIEERTRNTPTPFSISTATVPFGDEDQAWVRYVG